MTRDFSPVVAEAATLVSEYALAEQSESTRIEAITSQVVNLGLTGTMNALARLSRSHYAPYPSDDPVEPFDASDFDDDPVRRWALDLRINDDIKARKEAGELANVTNAAFVGAQVAIRHSLQYVQEHFSRKPGLGGMYPAEFLNFFKGVINSIRREDEVDIEVVSNHRRHNGDSN